MTELTIPHRHITRRLSKVEMTRQFLQDSIVTMEFHLEEALTNRNQETVETILDFLKKIRQMLRDLPVKTSQSWRHNLPKRL